MKLNNGLISWQISIYVSLQFISMLAGKSLLFGYYLEITNVWSILAMYNMCIVLLRTWALTRHCLETKADVYK